MFMATSYQIICYTCIKNSICFIRDIVNLVDMNFHFTNFYTALSNNVSCPGH